MKLNIKDPNWPYLHFSIPGKEAPGFVAFQGNPLPIIFAQERKTVQQLNVL